GSLAGLIGLGQNGTLEAGIDFGSGRIFGSLREGDGPLDIREVYSGFTGDPNPPLPELLVTEFEFSYDLGTGAYSAGLEVEGDWRLGAAGTPGGAVALDAIGFTIADDGGGLTFDSEAVIYVSTIPVNLAAAYATGGWQFDGSTAKGRTIPIGL